MIHLGSRDDACWLTYLTPVTAVVLAVALFFALFPPTDLPAASVRVSVPAAEPRHPGASLAAALAPSRNAPPPPSYVFVLVSELDHGLIAHRSLYIPQAYIDVRVVTNDEEMAEFTKLLFDMRAQMASVNLPEPLVLDTRGYW